MAQKTIKLPVTVGVVDHANSILKESVDASGKPVVMDGKEGRKLIYASVAIKHVEAGQTVTLESEEADRITKQFGVFDEAAEALRLKGVTVATARR